MNIFTLYFDSLAYVWPVNQSKNASNLIYPERNTTILHTKVCQINDISSTAIPYLIVIVCSAIHNFKARYSIRQSWAKDTNTLKSVKVVFLVGQHLNKTHQKMLEKEHEEYGDIIQESFIDTYANLTIKSLMLLKWFTKNCGGTQYVMKTDDDMYINLVRLYEIVQTNQSPNLLLGSLICNAIPIKDPWNKWFVPSYMFSEKMYPNYLSGNLSLVICNLKSNFVTNQAHIF